MTTFAGGTTQQRWHQSRFLKWTDEKCLTQVTDKLMRRDALLSFSLTKKEELVRVVKAGGCLSHCSHELVEFRVKRGRSKAKSRITTPDLEAADSSLFRDLLGRRHMALERHSGELVNFQGTPLQPRNWSIPMSRKPSKGQWRPACMNTDLQTKLKYKKEK